MTDRMASEETLTTAAGEMEKSALHNRERGFLVAADTAERLAREFHAAAKVTASARLSDGWTMQVIFDGIESVVGRGWNGHEPDRALLTSVDIYSSMSRKA